MKKTVVVNCFGGPGAGKTTAAWHMASELKKKGYLVEYVPEYAKELVWDKEFSKLDGSLENQLLLADEQEHRIKRLVGQVDFVVTDSPILLNALYFKPESKEQGQKYNDAIYKRFSRYTNFCLYINRGKSFEQQGRIHTLQESQQKDREIKAFLSDYKIYYGSYTHDSIDIAISNCETTLKRLSCPTRTGSERKGDGHEFSR